MRSHELLVLISPYVLLRGEKKKRKEKENNCCMQLMIRAHKLLIHALDLPFSCQTNKSHAKLEEATMLLPNEKYQVYVRVN